MRHAVRISLRISLVLAIGLQLGGAPMPLGAASRTPARGRQGMVVSASPLATDVGVEILKKGGNAVDAAVAVGFALAVTYPTAGNLGGGGFMVIHDARERRNTTIDYRERAPGGADRDMYLDAQGNVTAGLSTDGHLAVAVPGTPAGLLLALERYGTMDRRTVLEPAIRLAEQGFRIEFHLAESLRRAEERLALHPETRRIYLRNGMFFEEGDLFVQSELAATLRLIAARGNAGFYEGQTAQRIVQEMRQGGGLITEDDLLSYHPVERDPVLGEYRGHTIVSMPPPSSGGTVLLEMLNMLEPVDIAGLGHQSSGYVHQLVEVMKRAFADRAEFMGDPDFSRVPVQGLTSKSYAEQRRADLDPDRATPAEELGAGNPVAFESEETTHFSVVDGMGNAVSNTYTLNFGYGSGITVRGAGFLLNNIMDNFAAKQGVPNAYGLIQGDANLIAPGKRPLSSMTPTIVLKNGRVLLVAGSPGGPTIINTVLQVILNVLDHGFTVQEAVDAPRIHHQWLPDKIDFERRALVLDVHQALEAKGHALEQRASMGDAHAIVIDPDSGLRLGGADPRRGGKAAGY